MHANGEGALHGDNGLLETHVGDRLLPFTYRRVNSIDQGLMPGDRGLLKALVTGVRREMT